MMFFNQRTFQIQITLEKQKHFSPKLISPIKIKKIMNFIRRQINSLSRLILSTNKGRISRNVATRRKAPELPQQRGEQLKISGFGKFLLVRVMKFNIFRELKIST